MWTTDSRARTAARRSGIGHPVLVAIGLAGGGGGRYFRSLAPTVALLVTLAAGACASRTRVVPPQFPNLFGTIVSSDPDNDGEVFAHGQTDVTLRLSDGRRFVLPPSAAVPGEAQPGATHLLCRTRAINRADGTYAPPCRVQALVTRGRARWVRVIGAGMVGTAVRGSARWLVLADGTAIPTPMPPNRPSVRCPTDHNLKSVEPFTHRHHLVRVEAAADGTLARVSCLSKLTK